ncbi:MAG: hypothetical protein RO009_23160 [Pseudorhodoplanes sp.]|jgi:hypothetical protein|nr:hypothetical protein [Pseudorhodoplanes sp.]
MIAVPYTPAEVVARRERLLNDLQKFASGWTPSADDLAQAPVLSGWMFDFYPGSDLLNLVGVVTGHPRLPDGWVTTSPLAAIDLANGWARTAGRFYRLGERAPFKRVDDNDQVIDVTSGVGDAAGQS